jgi:hypothetical protein
VHVIPKAVHLNAEYFFRHISRDIHNNRSTDIVEDGQRNFVLHFDNPTPHIVSAILDIMQQHWMKRAIHPPFSPDLTSSDCYLFGKMKTALMGVTFED